MRLRRGPSCLDEPTGGADGREIGKQGEVQRKLDQISADKRASGVAPRDNGAELWAEAEAICERNGLPSEPAATGQPARSEAAPSGTSALSHLCADGKPNVPPIRSCPRCRRGMQPAATLCGWCWLRVAPMGADGIEPPPLALPKSPWWRFWGVR